MSVSGNIGRKLDLNSQNDQLQRTSNPTISWIIGLIILFILWTIFWQLVVSREFSQAKEEFRKDPSNPKSRVRLIEAAKFRISRARSALEVMALLDGGREVEKPEINLVAELKSLADLHASGHLTDDEFERAKAKLLNS